MKQLYEQIYIYFLLVYIVKLTHNDEYTFLSLILEMEIFHVSNKTFLIHQFQIMTNVPFKNINK